MYVSSFTYFSTSLRLSVVYPFFLYFTLTTLFRIDFLLMVADKMSRLLLRFSFILCRECNYYRRSVITSFSYFLTPFWRKAFGFNFQIHDNFIFIT